MKKLCILSAIALVCASCSTANENAKVDSWRIYCEKYNVDLNHPTSEEENFYLDCYMGSQEWDNDCDSARAAQSVKYRAILIMPKD